MKCRWGCFAHRIRLRKTEHCGNGTHGHLVKDRIDLTNSFGATDWRGSIQIGLLPTLSVGMLHPLVRKDLGAILKIHNICRVLCSVGTVGLSGSGLVA